MTQEIENLEKENVPHCAKYDKAKEAYNRVTRELGELVKNALVQKQNHAKHDSLRGWEDWCNTRTPDDVSSVFKNRILIFL